jgi:streptomycin 6-kinase
LPGTKLAAADADETAVVADLLERLPHEPGRDHPFRLLADEGARWTEDVPRRYEAGGRPFEMTLLDAALDIFASVAPRAGHLVNQDLHGGNVLRASREPWLAIDPKPLVGEREFDGVGVLRNAGFTRDTAVVRRWLDALVELGLDRERLRGFGVAHALAWGWDADEGWSQASIEAARTIHAS